MKKEEDEMDQMMIIFGIIICAILLCFLLPRLRIGIEIGSDEFKADGLIFKGMLLDDKGKYDKAIKKFLKAAEELSMSRSPLSMLCYFCLSNSYSKKGDKEKASEYLVKVNFFRFSLGREATRTFLCLFYINKLIIAYKRGLIDEIQKNYDSVLLYADKDTYERIIRNIKS